jgi:hypothetical protein
MGPTLHRRQLLALGITGATAALLPLGTAWALPRARTPMDAQLRITPPTSGLTQNAALLWLHPSGAEIPLWTADLSAAGSLAPANHLPIPAEDGVRLRLINGASEQTLQLTRFGAWAWVLSPTARIQVELAPRAEEVQG